MYGRSRAEPHRACAWRTRHAHRRAPRGRPPRGTCRRRRVIAADPRMPVAPSRDEREVPAHARVAVHTVAVPCIGAAMAASLSRSFASFCKPRTTIIQVWQDGRVLPNHDRASGSTRASARRKRPARTRVARGSQRLHDRPRTRPSRARPTTLRRGARIAPPRPRAREAAVPRIDFRRPDLSAAASSPAWKTHLMVHLPRDCGASPTPSSRRSAVSAVSGSLVMA